MSGKLVLVTGVSGFIAGHVVDQLLEKGYRVRGTVRGSKLESLRKSITVPGIELVQVDDIANGDLTEALKDVDIIMHVASPLPGKASVDEMLESAVEGTLNTVRQAEKAGIEKIVVTSSFVTLLHPSFKSAFNGSVLSETLWGDVTVEETRAQADNHFFVYCASKILAEKALWDFVRKHPKLDIATILPGFVFGPYSPAFPSPSVGSNGLLPGTNSYPHTVIKGGYPSPAPPYFVDVRDVAKAHILAIDLPRAKPEEKRFNVNWGDYTWKEVAEYLRKAYPELTTVAYPEKYTPLPSTLSKLDTEKSRGVLGLQYIAPEKTLDDLVAHLKTLEKA